MNNIFNLIVSLVCSSAIYLFIYLLVGFFWFGSAFESEELKQMNWLSGWYLIIVFGLISYGITRKNKNIAIGFTLILTSMSILLLLVILT